MERQAVATGRSWAFTLSPDWKWVAWAGDEGFTLYMAELASPAPRVIYRSKYLVDPMWADSHRLVYSGERSLVEFDVRTGAERPAPGIPSPVDHDRYVFVRYESGRADVVVIDRGRGVSVVVARNIGLNPGFPAFGMGQRVRWSPDGVSVAFWRIVDSRWTIEVVGADGTNRRSFPTPARSRDAFAVSWGPSARSITYLVGTWGEGTIDGTYVIDVASGSQTRITRLGGADWTPDGNRLVLAAYGGCEQTGIFVLTLEPRRMRRLTNSCRILGTSGDDHLVGTDDFDVLLGLDGDDRLEADVNHLTYSRDELHGGEGSDVIVGGSGPDAIFGEGGADRIESGARRDIVVGGPGRDVIDAGRGRDVVRARDGAPDTITCGPNAEAAPANTPDVVYADFVDVVGEDCERVFRR